MSAPKWHQTHMVGLDTETTGTDPRHEHIVTAAIVHTSPTARPIDMQWLIHPGTAIPEEAAAVHGWTLDRLEQRLQGHAALRIANGREVHLRREVALGEIAGQVASAMMRDVALVVCNASYDLTLLEAETRPGRAAHGHRAGQRDPRRRRPDGAGEGLGPLPARPRRLPGREAPLWRLRGRGQDPRLAVPALRHLPRRRARRRGRHPRRDAARRPAHPGCGPTSRGSSLSTLFEKQVAWRRQQADGLRKYFDKNGIDHDGVDPGWPLHTDLTNPQAVLA
ncbi:hypothetical protein G5V59_02710 [Nocardioides sp. W3-2-3]|nr:hypothetical protein [Nocardioides convexus]